MYLDKVTDLQRRLVVLVVVGDRHLSNLGNSRMSKDLILQFAIIGTDATTNEQSKLATEALAVKAEEQICEVQQKLRGKLCHQLQSISNLSQPTFNQAKLKTLPAKPRWSLILPNVCICRLLRTNVGSGSSLSAPLLTTWRG